MALESEILWRERVGYLVSLTLNLTELNIAKWPLMNRSFGRISQSQVKKVSNLITFDLPDFFEILWKF